MSLVKGLARPVPDFAKLHALEEQRVARWKRQHKKELTVPKGFKLNPAPPNAPPPGKQNAHDNEWLSDRERQKEREERLAYATRAAAEQRQQQEAASRPSTAAVRRPPSELGGRPYSAKPSQVLDDDASSAYAARPSAGGHPVTVQAYANNMANRSPSRPTSAADPGRTGSSSSSRFVSKVKDATSAVAEGEQQGGGGQAQRVGAPSAQMLYPTAFKGSRGYGSVVETNRTEIMRPAHADATKQGGGLPRRALAQQNEGVGQHRDRETEWESQRSRPTSAQYHSHATSSGRARDVQGAQAPVVPAPWEVPQGRVKGLSLNEMVLGATAPRGATASPQKGAAGGAGAALKGPNEASPPSHDGPSAQRFISASDSSDVSRAPTATLSHERTPHERTDPAPVAPAASGNAKGPERPTSAVKRLPEARPSTAGRRRFSEVDSPQLDGRGSSASGAHGLNGSVGAGAAHAHPPRDTLVPSSAVENGLMRGPSAPAHSEGAVEADRRTAGWATRPMSATQRAAPSPVNAAAHELAAHAHAHAHGSPKMPQTQAQHRAYDKAIKDAYHERLAREHAQQQADAAKSEGKTAAQPPESKRVATAPEAASVEPGGLGPLVKSADIQNRPGKDMSAEQLQSLVRTITTTHLKGLQQPFSSCDFYAMGKTLGEGAYGKVKLAVHRITGEKVAVKTFEKSKLTEAQAQKRVAREVRILKALLHPHIIRLYEVVEEPYRRLIMMEYSSGGDLCRYVRDNRRLNEAEAARLFVQIVDGLAYCHACGIVHRDVKLDNLLLDSHRNIRIVDFGFSVSFQKGQKLRKACGSPSYAAPEIVARRPYSPPGVDVWSLGIVLYAMVCGYFPFQGSNNQDLCRKIVKGRFECPSFMSAECRDLVRLMLNVDPVKRITLDDCARHIWARSAYAKKPPIDHSQAPVRTIDCEASIDSVAGGMGTEADPELVDKLAGLGFLKAYTQQCVRNNRHNLCNTTYYLLQQKKLKENGRKQGALLGQ